MLNYDVMADILTFLHGAELLPAMWTCRTLYRAGVPLLLQHQVVIRTRAKLISFCRFMLHDPPPRFRCLRHLEISVPGRFKAPHKAGLLLALLEHATALESLNYES